MDFEFSEDTHKWCERCGANIRSQATWCKFCRSNLVSRLRSGIGARPRSTIAGAARWLPNFEELIRECEPGIQIRFKKENENTEQDETHLTYAQVISKRPITDAEYPVEKGVRGLLEDVILSWHECGGDLERLCSDSRMAALDITPSSICAEASLRKREKQSGKQCRYCCEFLLSEDSPCRFCESRGDEKPKQFPLMRSLFPLDHALLAEIVLWECARRQTESQPLPSEEILQTNKITPEKIEQEIQRQLLNPDDLPKSKWRRKLLELNFDSDPSFKDVQITDVISVASACGSASRHDEEELVYQHGLRRANTPSTVYLRSTMIEGLSQVCYSKKDYENHHRLKKEAEELRLSTLPADKREEFLNSRKMADSAMMRITEPAPSDPNKALQQAEERLKNLLESQEKRINDKSTNPMLRKSMIEQLAGIKRALGPGMASAKLHLRAQEARNLGDYSNACRLLEESISMLGDEVMDVLKHSTMLSELAEIQMLNGDPDSASKSHQQAISKAGVLAELNQGMEHGLIGYACTGYAKFLMQTQKYDEAEDLLKRALELDTKEQEHNANVGFRKKPSEQEAVVKEELVKLLRMTEREEEASKLEIQVAALRKSIDDDKQKQANDRRNYHEMITEKASEDA